MIPISRRGQSSRWLATCLASASVLASALALGTRAADDPPGKLPPDLEELVSWLPEDTETLFVARSATLGDPEGVDPMNYRWSDLGAGYAVHDDSATNRRPLLGRKAKLIVRGARNFSGVAKAGGYRSEGCSIIRFEAPWGDGGRELTDALRGDKEASVRTVARREVFCYPPPKHESWVRRVPWEGMYLALLAPDTLLCASSDAYLEAVLHRIDAATPPNARALPDSLPEWKCVDLASPAWMLRHAIPAGEKHPFSGLTVSYRDDGYRVIYVPIAGQEIWMEGLRKSWSVGEPICPRGTLARRPDGTVAFEIATPPAHSESFWVLWYGVNMEGINGVYEQ